MGKDGNERKGVRREAGAWLQARLEDAFLQAAYWLAFFLGIASSAVLVWVHKDHANALAGTLITMAGAGAFSLCAMVYALFRGYGVRNMRKGARSERRVGHAIEYALTAQGCAVAHNVTRLGGGDIDHLVLTPRGIYVVETKSGFVPKKAFPRLLTRLSDRAATIRRLMPHFPVQAVLVFAEGIHTWPGGSKVYRARSNAGSQVHAFESPRAFMQHLARERDQTLPTDPAAHGQAVAWVWSLAGEPA